MEVNKEKRKMELALIWGLPIAVTLAVAILVAGTWLQKQEQGAGQEMEARCAYSAGADCVRRISL